jgi:hypothetical protein
MFYPDLSSSTWKWIEKHIEDRKKILYESISSPNLDMVETQLARGQLLELRELAFSAQKIARSDSVNG